MNMKWKVEIRNKGNLTFSPEYDLFLHILRVTIIIGFYSFQEEWFWCFNESFSFSFLNKYVTRYVTSRQQLLSKIFFFWKFKLKKITEWLILLNQNPPFFPPKRAKNRHQFFTLKKLTPLSFLLYFYVVIFPMPTQNCKKRF